MRVREKKRKEKKRKERGKKKGSSCTRGQARLWNETKIGGSVLLEMDSVAVTVPLRQPTKKMKKRKELDALAPPHTVSRRSSGKRSSQVRIDWPWPRRSSFFFFPFFFLSFFFFFFFFSFFFSNNTRKKFFRKFLSLQCYVIDIYTSFANGIEMKNFMRVSLLVYLSGIYHK